jgi:predicted Fe-S protein YdhL (DUF1289 family)
MAVAMTERESVISGVRQETVPSPCVSICALDDNDICVGCFRSGREISDWGRLGDEEKRAVLKRCVERSSQ